MELETLQALYVDELKDLWSAVQQIIRRCRPSAVHSG
jgi:hypothetical protein